MVGRVLVGALVVLLFGGTASLLTALAVRTWRDPGEAGRTKAIMSARATETFAWGMTRGIAVFAAGFVGLAGIAIAGVVISGFQPARPGVAWLALPGVLLGVFVLCWLVLLPMIICFNRPRMLVVPYMRDDDGALIAWWHKRRS